MKSLEEQFEKNINHALDSDRKRIIEILGFFSAIIAFILSTVSIGKNYKYIEALNFMLGLGIILVLFALTMSLFFNRNEKKLLYKDYKFWILIIALIAMLLLILTNNYSIICIFC
jgi:Mn2+/Fe2+ NRAMP family transporter